MGKIARTIGEYSSRIFFTICNEKYKGLIPVSIYGHLVNNEKLGDFTYDEVDAPPLTIKGFIQNGTGYGIYVESFYFASSGNYRTFFFANLPYGLLEIESAIIPPGDDYELRGTNIDVDPITSLNRKESFPSTFGIIARHLDNDSVFDILSDFRKIDYNSLLMDLG